ncbi:MAG: hypothetical protein Q7T03_08340 [Deltaproteobacteria bacterium]|nr:hypothetical protein [Deltaproteobacteria bacterium]
MACYQFPEDSCFKQDKLQLDSITVCDVPIKYKTFGKSWTPNSGTHRIVSDVRYDQERFVIVLEEKEDFHCRFMADIVLIGAFSAEGEAMAKTGGFIPDIVRQIITSATGIIPEFDEYLLVPEFRFMNDTKFDKPLRINRVSRFHVQFVKPEELIAQGCSLSAEARGCALISNEPDKKK